MFVHAIGTWSPSPIHWLRLIRVPLALDEKTANAVLEVAKQASKEGGPFLGREHAIYQSDNGAEYINKEFKTWVGDDRFRHGLPFNPTTQGQVPLISL